MARLNTRTLKSHSRPDGDPNRFQPASAAAAEMRLEIRAVVRRAGRAAAARSREISTISDDPLRKSLGGD